MKSNLFSEAAMERLSTPEKLDKQVRLISPAIIAQYSAVMVGVIAAVLWVMFGSISYGEDYMGVIYSHDDVVCVNTKIDGIIHDILVVEGDHVNKGDVIATLYNKEIVEQISALREEQSRYEATSQRYREIANELLTLNGRMVLRSEIEGLVQSVEMKGTAIVVGDTVATVVPESFGSYNEVYLYMPKEEAGAFEPGMEAQITPSYVSREEYGYMSGVISSISSYLISDNYILKHMGTLNYVDGLRESGNCVEIVLQLDVAADEAGGYVWSNPKGEDIKVKSGDRCSVRIIKKEYHPYELLFSN